MGSQISPAERERRVEEEYTTVQYLSRLSSELRATHDARQYTVNKVLHIIWDRQKERPRG